MQKQLTFEEWKKIGKQFKLLRKTLLDTLKILNEFDIPKLTYINNFLKTKKHIDKMRSDLEEVSLYNQKSIIHLPDNIAVNIFYGKDIDIFIKSIYGNKSIDEIIKKHKKQEKHR